MTSQGRYFNSTRIAMIAVFSALAGILHAYAKFRLPFAFPEFLEFDFSDIPLFIGTFALGPLSGCIIVVVKLLIKLAFAGTGSMFVGDLANLFVGIAFVIPAGLIYKKMRTRKGAALALTVGSLSSITVAIFTNWLILIPFYVQVMFHGSWEPLLGMMTPLFPGITRDTFFLYYLLVSVLPFNLLRCLVASLVSIFIYKYISRAIERMSRKLAPKEGKERAAAGRDLALFIVFAVAVLLLVLFALLNYFVW